MESRSPDAPENGPPVLVVSPHYDDAVFSCGDLLAARPGSTVVTVYTGTPELADCSTDWDRRCGFTNAYDAMRAREEENRRALGSLAAAAVDLGFLDDQYIMEPSTDTDRLIGRLSGIISDLQPAQIFAPLGLFHADHVSSSDILMALCPMYRATEWFVYEEIPYRAYRGLVQVRLSWLLSQGLTATPAITCRASGCKAIAVAAYRSQLTGLGPGSGPAILRQPESYWRLSDREE